MTTLDQARYERMIELEARGELDPTCATCVKVFYPYYRETWEPGRYGPFAPSHKPSPRCRSGKYPHCTCDTCF